MEKPKLWQALLALAITVGTGFLLPLVCVDLWAWFVVPLGVKPVLYWQAFGLLLLVNLQRSYKTATAEEKEKFLEVSLGRCFVVLLAWWMGYGCS